MAKKDFSNANTDPVYRTIAEATAEEPTQEAQPVEEAQEAQQPQMVLGRYGLYHKYTPQGSADEAEQLQRAEDMQTQGRKGCKLPRINMAFSAENHEYLKVMAGITGLSLTQLCNQIVEEHRKAHGEQYEAAKNIKRSL